MKLDDFISESIKQIIDGIEIATVHAETKGAKISGKNLGFIGAKNGAGIVFYNRGTEEIVERIDFDIAVTIKEGDKSKGGIGLHVGGIGIGAQGQIENENSSVSRIKFSVPFYLPEKAKT